MRNELLDGLVPGAAEQQTEQKLKSQQQFESLKKISLPVDQRFKLCGCPVEKKCFCDTAS
ncbi:MAG: hypothetical protein WC087_01280 [Candidatus Paceibacterota bacterium]